EFNTLLTLTCFLFFFQAEDGIRHFHVTGVQTCALPICKRRKASYSTIHSRRHTVARRRRATRSPPPEHSTKNEIHNRVSTSALCTPADNSSCANHQQATSNHPQCPVPASPRLT